MTSSGSASFDALRDGLARDVGVRHELEGALRLNVDRVSPSDRGNRFIVGGAVEWLVAAAAWSLGVLTLPGGHGANGFDLVDLQDAARGMWSVKSQSSSKKAAWRITNGLVGSGRGLTEPTVFVSPQLPGLVFVDPDRHAAAGETYDARDAVMLPFAAVLSHALANPECVAPLDAPVNEGRGRENPFLAYAETIATPERFPRLSAMFQAAKPRATGVAGDVAALVAMRDSGMITDEEFHGLVRKTAGL